jgi:hypothetical protein
VKTSTNNPTKTETVVIQSTKEIDQPKAEEKDNMFTNKIDLDYIPGLDDDLKVIIPGKIYNNLQV